MVFFLRKLFTPATSSARDAGRSRRTPTGPARPALETLERRDLLSAGAFDLTFGHGGRTTADYSYLLGSSAQAQAVAVQPDGKIVVVGTVATDSTHHYFGVVRLKANGTYDTSFGQGGRQYVTFYDLLGGSNDYARTVAVDPQGRIVVAGSADTPKGSVFAVTRLTSNGSFDAGFGLKGRQYFTYGDLLGNSGDGANAVTIDKQGRIVLAGSASTTANGGGIDFAVARLNSNGSFDTSFGLKGRQYFTFSDLLHSPYDFANAVTLDAKGRILVAGSASTPNAGGTDFAVARLTTSGSFDTSFGLRGRQYFGFGDLLGGTDDVAYAVATDAQGRIVLGGSASTTFNGGGTDFAVGRLTAGGSFDTSFGLGGRQYVTFRDLVGSNACYASSMAIDKQGRIVLAGTALTDANHGNGSDFAVTRLTSNGSFDSSFGLEGRQYVTFSDVLGGPYDSAYAMTLDALGNIVLAGTGTTKNGSAVALTRLQG